MSSNTLILLNKMIKMQNMHNLKVDSEWRTQGFPYRRAIWMECAELIDQLGWKWWAPKQETPDRVQLILEVVDIWHFGLSMLILENRSPPALAEELDRAFEQSNKETDVVDMIENFVSKTLESECFLLPQFIDICCRMDVHFQDLYRYYIGKHVLNQFRQSHGYKTGQYRKNWQGKEDNQHLAESLEHNKLISVEDQKRLYEDLAAIYQQG